MEQLNMEHRPQKLFNHMEQLSRELKLKMSLDGTILESNLPCLLLTGWTKAELHAFRFSELAPPEDEKYIHEQIELIKKEKASNFPFKNRFRTVNNSCRWISWRACADEQFLFFVGQDITAEEDALHALNASRVALQQADNIDTDPQRLREISHDFNNQLQSIVAALELIRKLISLGRMTDAENLIANAIASAQRAAIKNAS